MSGSRKIRRKRGDIVRIPLADGRVAFGWVLDEPLVAFFDFVSDEPPALDLAELVQKPIAFRIWVMNRATSEGRWEVVCRADPPSGLTMPPRFYKQDPISKRISITETGAEEVPSSADECRGLEAAAVWDPEHVEDRLVDHFSGRPNKWLRSLAIR